MSTSRKFKIPISRIKEVFFVRESLDEEWVIQLAQLYEGGVELPPIELTKKDELVDGRHRLEALKLLNRTEVDCVLVEETDRLKLIALAFAANVGGAKPPTQDDIKFTIRVLLREGVTRRRVLELMPYPKEVTRRYVDDVQSAEAKLKMNRAMDAVVEGGMTVKAAAQEMNVDEAKLKEALKGKKKAAKSGKNQIAQIKANFTTQFKRLSTSNGKSISVWIQKYEDGVITHKEMQELLQHLSGLIERMRRAHLGRVKRFKAAEANTEVSPTEVGE